MKEKLDDAVASWLENDAKGVKNFLLMFEDGVSSTDVVKSVRLETGRNVVHLTGHIVSFVANATELEVVANLPEVCRIQFSKVINNKVF